MRTIKPTFKRSLIGAVLVGGAVAAIGGTGAAAANSAHKLGTVTIRLDSDWDTIDPARVSSIQGHALIRSEFDRLVYETPSGTFEPYVASSWKVSTGSVTFKIRPGIACHDGAKVTAGVVAGSLKRVFQIGAPEPSGALGPKPWNATVLRGNRVKVSVGSKTTELLNVLANPWASIVCPAGWAKSANFETHDYGSGPYKLVSATHGSQVVMKRDPGWTWGPAGTDYSTMPSALDFKVVVSETTAANLVSTGGLNIAEVQGPDVTRLASNKSMKDIRFLQPGATTGFFNERAGLPASDPKVRQALTTAIGTKDYVLSAGPGHQLATDVGAPTWTCYTNLSALLPEVKGANLAAAAQILAADGWSKNSSGSLSKNGQPLKIVLLAVNTEGAGPQYIQQQWSKLGVDVVFDQFPRAQWLSGLLALNFDFATDVNTNALGPQADLASDLGPYYPNGPDVFGTNNPTAYSDLLAEESAPSPAARCGLWKKLATSLYTNYDVIPLAINQTNYFTNGGISFVPAQNDEINPFTIK